MQPSELSSTLLREHYLRALEGTNNLLFECAIAAPLNDKRVKFPDSLRAAFNWPENIQTMYDYRSRYVGIYDRLYQQCVVSLCSDIEIMFRELFETGRIPPGPGRGFYQRLDDVIAILTDQGYLFPESDISALRFAFNIRHIVVHNSGLIDHQFLEHTDSRQSVGERFEVGVKNYKASFDAYCRFLKCLDTQFMTNGDSI